MSGSGLWFSRFTAGSEGWLPLFELGEAVWQGVASGMEAQVAASAPNACAPNGTGRVVAALAMPQTLRLEA